MTGKIIRPAPAEIEYRNMGRNMRFLITDQPQVLSVTLLLLLLLLLSVSQLGISLAETSFMKPSLIYRFAKGLSEYYSISPHALSE